MTNDIIMIMIIIIELVQPPMWLGGDGAHTPYFPALLRKHSHQPQLLAHRPFAREVDIQAGHGSTQTQLPHPVLLQLLAASAQILPTTRMREQSAEAAVCAVVHMRVVSLLVFPTQDACSPLRVVAQVAQCLAAAVVAVPLLQRMEAGQAPTTSSGVEHFDNAQMPSQRFASSLAKSEEESVVEEALCPLLCAFVVLNYLLVHLQCRY
mmetsp:Transcript_23263/g.38797  ORF Transcript_23263/g.38797 Transcript_23263/m.38797 type:complete len:208 (+) Transcript_23263:105-728(+)